MVVQHVSRLVSDQGGFYIDKESVVFRVILRAGAAIGPVDARVANHTERAVVVSCFGITTEHHLAHVDRNAEVHSDLANGHCQISKLIPRVGARVADHDETTTAQNHFVEPEIFKVSAVGKIDIPPLAPPQPHASLPPCPNPPPP